MIDISNLSIKKIERENTRNKVYKLILDKCIKKIITVSNSNIEEEYIYYSIPKIIFGFPLINREKCSIYIINELLKNKFIVKYLGNGNIFISWKNIVCNKKQIKNTNIKQLTNTNIKQIKNTNIKQITNNKINTDKSYKNIHKSIKFIL